MKRSQKSKRKKSKQTDLVILQLRVHKGMIDFLNDHAALFEEKEGTRTPAEYFEQALEGDFDAMVDGMRLDHEMIYSKYEIPDNWTQE